MAKFVRTDGPKKNCRAELHDYDGVAKIEIEVPIAEAKFLMDMATGKGGSLPAEMIVLGNKIQMSIIGARIDSYDSNGSQVGGTGVISFGSVRRET